MSITLSPDEADALRESPPPPHWSEALSSPGYAEYLARWWQSNRRGRLEFADAFLKNWTPGQSSYSVSALYDCWVGLSAFDGLVSPDTKDSVYGALEAADLAEQEELTAESENFELIVAAVGEAHSQLAGYLASHYAAFLEDLEAALSEPPLDELHLLNFAAVKAMVNGLAVDFVMYGNVLFIGEAMRSNLCQHYQRHRHSTVSGRVRVGRARIGAGHLEFQPPPDAETQRVIRDHIASFSDKSVRFVQAGG